MHRILLLLPFLLWGRDALDSYALGSLPPRGQITVAGSGVMVPLEHSMLAFDGAMPSLLATRARIAQVQSQSRGEGAGMQDLCGPSAARPDIVLLTRSPQAVEIRRCEAAGIKISADLVALYHGGLAGAPPFSQLWIAFVPMRLERNGAAARAVRTLRYDFSRLIEGTVYEPYFTARRG